MKKKFEMGNFFQSFAYSLRKSAFVYFVLFLFKAMPRWEKKISLIKRRCEEQAGGGINRSLRLNR